jgi:ribosomal protein S18 acetylase RimI-like enzyme
VQIAKISFVVGEDQVVRLRRATQEDDRFLVEVYSSIREDELALTDWNASQRTAFVEMQFRAQQSHYREYYPEGEQYVILSGDTAIGRLYVAEIEKEVRILDITVLPKHRGGGIGRRVIEALLAEGTAIGKPVRIYVESYNRSLGLFQRLGFSKIDENEHSYLMEWRAEEGTARPGDRGTG